MFINSNNTFQFIDKKNLKHPSIFITVLYPKLEPLDLSMDTVSIHKILSSFGKHNSVISLTLHKLFLINSFPRLVPNGAINQTWLCCCHTDMKARDQNILALA